MVSLHLSQVNRSHGWEIWTNTKWKVAHYQLPDTMRLCKADDFCDHPGHYPSPHCLLIYWADLYDSPSDSEARAIVYSRRLLTQLCCISSLSWANCTQSPLTMHGYWPLPPIIGCYWGVSSQSQKHLRLAMATIRLETTSNFAWTPNISNTTHVPSGTQRIQALLSFFYIC